MCLSVSHFAESNSPVPLLPESAPVSQLSTEYHSQNCLVAALLLLNPIQAINLRVVGIVEINDCDGDNCAALDYPLIRSATK